MVVLRECVLKLRMGVPGGMFLGLRWGSYSHPGGKKRESTRIRSTARAVR